MNNNQLSKLKLITLCSTLALGLSACGGSNGNNNGSGSGSGSDGEGSSPSPSESTNGNDTTVKTSFTAKDFEKQIFISKEDATALLFNAGNTGIEYGEYEGDESAGGQESPFTWTLTPKKISTTYSNQTSTRTVDYTYNKIVGNKYTVLLNDHEETPYKHDLYKAKPLKIADLDGKIFQLSTKDNECFSKTLKMAGNQATLKQDCINGVSAKLFSMTSSADIDNSVVFNATDGDGSKRTSTMLLIGGNLSSTATAAFLQKKNNVYKEVSFNTLKLTKKETVDTIIPITPTLVANKVFWFKGGHGGYQKLIFSSSGDSVVSKESKQNQISTSEFTPVFLNGKMQISGNNGDRDFFLLFTLKSKTDKLWKFKRQDGKNNPTYAVDTWYLSKPAGFPADL